MKEAHAYPSGSHCLNNPGSYIYVCFIANIMLNSIRLWTTSTRYLNYELLQHHEFRNVADI